MSSGRFYPNSDHAVEPSQPAKQQQPAAERTPLEQRRPFFDRSDHVIENSPSSRDPAAPSQPSAPAERDGGDLGVTVPDNIRKLRESDRSPYDAMGTYRSALGVGTLNEALPGAAEPVVREVANIFRDAGLTDGEAQHVLATLKAAPTEEMRAQWSKDTERYLRTISDADAQGAVQLLDRDPRVAAILERTGAINNPAIVRLLVEKARAERTRGRL